MIGVLVSSNTLRGEPNQWPNRYAKKCDIAGIFTDHPDTFNVIHYNTNEPDSLLAQLLAVRHLAGPNLHGFQLNMAWPSPGDLRLFSQRNPDQRLIIQLNQEAFQVVEGLKVGIISKLKLEYSGLVDHVLFDLSAGFGRPLDTAWARQQLQELQDADLGIGLGVAGGLSPTSLHLVEPLVKDFPQLSLDAEARLRDAEDNLDLNLAQRYLRQAFTMFGN
ncbi:MAG: hypothetical protein O2909_02920 [Chloroflexi bacterium]|nr:hypothetical protein [Chloroflexota bacterium]MDA1218376.1 hypothetical protein [Chloroflexota bacterium]